MIGLAIALLTMQQPAAAQAFRATTAEQAGGERLRNVTYQNVEFLKFRHDDRVRAEEIWDRFFVPAMQRAGRKPPQVLHMLTGNWDWLILWPMEGGPADLEWVTHPSESRMVAEVEVLAGGPEPAAALLKEWSSLITTSKSDVSHEHAK